MKQDFTLLNQNVLDSLAYQIVKPYLPNDKNFFPVTNSSIHFHSLLAILNDIKLNNRKNLIEFGGGLSTITILKFAIVNNLNFTLTTIEHDEKFINIIKNVIIKENISSEFEIVHAPLKGSIVSNDDMMWYDLKCLNEKIGSKKFDLVIVDGPPAWEKNKDTTRYAALPFIYKKLFDSYSIFLDDVHREGEKKIMKIWENEFEIQFKYINNYFAHAHKGHYYNIIL